jgi:hypothetical protein
MNDSQQRSQKGASETVTFCRDTHTTPGKKKRPATFSTNTRKPPHPTKRRYVKINAPTSNPVLLQVIPVRIYYHGKSYVA